MLLHTDEVLLEKRFKSVGLYAFIGGATKTSLVKILKSSFNIHKVSPEIDDLDV